MGMAEPLGEQVMRRALEVERMGQYIGAFELVPGGAAGVRSKPANKWDEMPAADWSRVIT